MATTYKKVELLNPVATDEVLHPVTTAEAVKFSDGSTLESARTYVKGSITLSNAWDVSSGSYTQTFSDSNITDKTDIEISLSSIATPEQTEAFYALDLVGGGQVEGSFTVKCRNDVLNTISIPLEYKGTVVKMYLLDVNTPLDIIGSINAHKERIDNPHAVTKAQVGLDLVDNTSDANKPISEATQSAINKMLGTKSIVLTTTWVGSVPPYTQVVSVPEITSTDSPRIYPEYSSELTTATKQAEEIVYITYWDTGSGTVTFTCLEGKPSVPITLVVKGV